MRTALVLGLLGVLLLFSGPSAFGEDQKDVRTMPECRYCGMHRKNFLYSRMVAYHGNGRSVGICSINCAAIDNIENLEDPPGSFKVGDYKTKKLIDAEKAYWVLGGSKPGVMTERAKWAFKKRSDAEDFVKKHGGTITDFNEAMKASYEDIYEDMRELAEMKQEHACSKHVAHQTESN